MQNLFHTTLAATLAAALLLSISAPAPGQTAYRPPRTPDGHADLSGIYEAINTANWDLEDHSPQPGTMWQTGAINSEPAGESVVEGGVIPYKPAALEKKKANFADRRTKDPEAKCYMPGIPRANYMPYPFQIVQTPRGIYVRLRVRQLQSPGQHGQAGGSGLRYLDGHQQRPLGRRHAGDRRHRSERPGVVRPRRRFRQRPSCTSSNALQPSPIPYHLNYEATIEDPSVFTRPWKISMPLYRKVEKDAQLLEFKCMEFAEELLYGQYKKQPGSK